MTRAIAQALGFYGVNVNALVYGPMDFLSLTAEEAAERLRRIPVGRLGKPEDLVGAAIFLATDDSNFVCGESLYVDAGYSNAAVTEDSFRPAWGTNLGQIRNPARTSSKSLRERIIWERSSGSEYAFVYRQCRPKDRASMEGSR